MSNVYLERLKNAEKLVHAAHLGMLDPRIDQYPNRIYEPLYTALNELRDEIERVEREAEDE